jgi:hypothetical protein
MSVSTSVGTDATIAQHIETITEREYVVTKQEGNTKYLAPSTLGIGLIEGYDKLGFNKSFSKPFLRREARKESILLVFLLMPTVDGAPHATSFQGRKVKARHDPR